MQNALSFFRMLGQAWQNTALALLLVLTAGVCPALAVGVGAPAPGFTLPTVAGGQASLNDFKGKIVVLKIGTTWCPGCRDQSRELQRADELLAGEGVALIEVFVDENAPTVKRYQQSHPMQKTPVTTLLGDDRFARAYNVYTIPRLLILDPTLKVVIDSGGLTAEQIRAQLLQLKNANK